MASDVIAEWTDKHGTNLPSPGADVWALSDHDIESVEAAYCELHDHHGSRRNRTKPCDVRFGPTGTAKILFALRPHCFPPWDKAIADWLRKAKGIDSYSQFVVHVRDTLDSLANLCRVKGFALKELPSRIGRPDSTLVKLIDEYYWVTITRKWKSPDRKTLSLWLDWDDTSE